MPGAEMAVTAKKFEPRDLCLIHAENDPRVSSRRVAEEAQPRKRGPRTDNINDFIERNKAELERYGNIPCHKVYSGKRGQPAFEYLLNEDQVTIALMRLDTPEAADARFEIVQLMRAYRRGEIPQSQITIIADLFDPKPPTIVRGDDNVVHVTPHPSEWSPSYDRWRERTIEATWPFPVGFLETIADIGRTPQGFGDSTEDKPTMFMRDELPLGHSADSWRVWVSEQWFRLPLNLRQRWWRDTDYGNRAPSPEIIQAIIFIALP
jgi:hypothetical protein